MHAQRGHTLGFVRHEAKYRQWAASLLAVAAGLEPVELGLKIIEPTVSCSAYGLRGKADLIIRRELGTALALDAGLPVGASTRLLNPSRFVGGAADHPDLLVYLTRGLAAGGDLKLDAADAVARCQRGACRACGPEPQAQHVRYPRYCVISRPGLRRALLATGQFLWVSPHAAPAALGLVGVDPGVLVRAASNSKAGDAGQLLARLMGAFWEGSDCSGRPLLGVTSAEAETAAAQALASRQVRGIIDKLKKIAGVLDVVDRRKDAMYLDDALIKLSTPAGGLALGLRWRYARGAATGYLVGPGTQYALAHPAVLPSLDGFVDDANGGAPHPRLRFTAERPEHIVGELAAALAA